jgi:hypothetical protein
LATLSRHQLSTKPGVELASPLAVAVVGLSRGLTDKGQHMALPKRPRSSIRKMRSHDAWITIEGDVRNHECKVADISATGAKLVSDADVPVGSLLKLSISPHAMVSKPCEVVWRRGRQIGVRFIK